MSLFYRIIRLKGEGKHHKQKIAITSKMWVYAHKRIPPSTCNCLIRNMLKVDSGIVFMHMDVKSVMLSIFYKNVDTEN